MTNDHIARTRRRMDRRERTAAGGGRKLHARILAKVP
jgi:hypothetical protein